MFLRFISIFIIFTIAGCGGGGGGNSASSAGGSGGSGVVIVKESQIFLASNCWDLRQVYRQIKADEWA